MHCSLKTNAMHSFLSASFKFTTGARKHSPARLVRPVGLPMACYKRMDTADLEDLIDLSTKSKKETEVCLNVE